MKRLYPEQPIISIGALIVCKGQILLEKRKNEPSKGKWSIPGGVVELGERLEKTVIREVKEETGLTIANVELVDVINSVTYDENGKIKYHFVIMEYFARIKAGTIQASSDAEELRWVSLIKVEEYDLTKSFRDFFIKNREKLEKMESCL